MARATPIFIHMAIVMVLPRAGAGLPAAPVDMDLTAMAAKETAGAETVAKEAVDAAMAGSTASILATGIADRAPPMFPNRAPSA